MFPCRVLLVLFVSLSTEIQWSHATVVSVNGTDGKLCLYADLMMKFSVTYDIGEDKNETVVFELPDEVTTDGSVCDNTISTLKLNFPTGHTWTVTFSNSDKTYQADVITFEYNLSDRSIFPNSISNETVSVSVNKPIIDVGMDTCYSCKSQVVLLGDAVQQTLWNVLIQAFVSDGSKSENTTPCPADTTRADNTTTTAAPTTAAPTTAAPTTAAPTTAAPTTVAPTTTAPTTTAPTTTAPTTTAPTTVAPTTSAGNITTEAPGNVTTAAPTTIPTTTATPSLPTPVTGKYAIKHDENSTACLLANFGLRLGFKQGEKLLEINLDPNGTIASGTCGPNSSDLVLTSDTITLVFTFTNETNKFKLHALNVTGTFSGANSNLSLWQAAVGSSYMCNKQQSFNITNSLTLYTFDLRVQPFAVNKGDFSTAHECSMDDTSILIPIIVGAALAGLILIVVIAYVIGRKKTYVGYQTL